MVTSLGVTSSELTATMDAVYNALQKPRKEQDIIKDLEQARKNHTHHCELFGAYYAVVRLLGGVSDENWQEFLKGGK